MAKIDGTQSLISALRAQLVARSEAQKSTGTRSSSVSNEAAKGRSTIAIPELRALVGKDLKRFDLSSPPERKRARQLFLEAVIAWDLGEQLMTDQRWSSIIKEVDNSISSDASASDAFDTLLKQLQSATG